MSLDLSSLNYAQIDAVTAIDENILIIAGPGTGKTQTLAFRTAYLIRSKDVSPASIIAITFTNKAAREMRERVSNLLCNECNTADIWIGTFHSLGLAILREEGHRVGLRPDFLILSESEQIELVKSVLSDTLPKEPLIRAKRWVQRLSERKNHTFSSQSVSDLPDILFSAYEHRLEELNLIDFDDLILKPLILFKENPEVRDNYRNRFCHLLVDEYQDINNLQYQFLKKISGPAASLWVIGDADQAIYAFRGANVEHFLKFQQDYPDVRTIALKENYRSTRTILTSAQTVIAHNSDRIPHTLTSSASTGLPVHLLQAANDKAEARLVVKEIEKLIGGIRMESSFEGSDSFGFNEIAILYRLHHISRFFSEALKQSGIPYQVVGGGSSHPDSSLEYIVPFLKTLLNPHDDLSFSAILPAMDKKFDRTTITQLLDLARDREGSLYQIFHSPKIDGLLDPYRIDSDHKLLSFLHRMQKEMLAISLRELIATICQGLNLNMPLEDENHPWWFLLTEPFSDGPAHDQLPKFLETVALLKEGETYNSKAEAVTLMTVHAAKGLEFPVVFMVGLESGIFPCTEFGEGPSDLEEERRLFYVGMTRAKKRLYLSCSQSRYLFGENREAAPSSFISEIPPEMITVVPDHKSAKAKKIPTGKQRSLFT